MVNERISWLMTLNNMIILDQHEFVLVDHDRKKNSLNLCHSGTSWGIQQRWDHQAAGECHGHRSPTRFPTKPFGKQAGHPKYIHAATILQPLQGNYCFDCNSVFFLAGYTPSSVIIPLTKGAFREIPALRPEVHQIG